MVSRILILLREGNDVFQEKQNAILICSKFSKKNFNDGNEV
jgi:hypothetical protein